MLRDFSVGKKRLRGSDPPLELSYAVSMVQIFLLVITTYSWHWSYHDCEYGSNFAGHHDPHSKSGFV